MSRVTVLTIALVTVVASVFAVGALFADSSTWVRGVYGVSVLLMVVGLVGMLVTSWRNRRSAHGTV